MKMMPALSSFDVEVCRMQQFEQQVFNVFTDIASFSQSRGIADRKWHLKRLGQGLGQQRLARTGRSDQKDVGLFNLNFFRPDFEVVHQSLVMAMHCDGQQLLGFVLPDDVLIQLFDNFSRGWDAIEELLG
jgi:hypothetical protein